ncbi:MAG: autoinducer binding domain-containing protein [Burkholderiaceae bacterium]
MQQWAQDLASSLEQADNVDDVFDVVQNAASALGFERTAFGLRYPGSVVRPTFKLVNNYPEQWRERYAQAAYLDIDPSIKLAARTQRPILWSDALFADAPDLWSEAQAADLRVGWAQSRFDGTGAGSLLTLARSHEPLRKSELTSKAMRLNWLVSLSHEAFTRVLVNPRAQSVKAPLTPREIEVLKWAADGKTNEDIAAILTISEDTVKFHARNFVSKLQATNRMHAVVRAVVLGLLT